MTARPTKALGPVSTPFVDGIKFPSAPLKEEHAVHGGRKSVRVATAKALLASRVDAGHSGSESSQDNDDVSITPAKPKRKAAPRAVVMLGSDTEDGPPVVALPQPTRKRKHSLALVPVKASKKVAQKNPAPRARTSQTSR